MPAYSLSSRSYNSFQNFDITPDLARKTAVLAQIQITDEEVRRTLASNVWRLVFVVYVCWSHVLVPTSAAAFSRVPLDYHLPVV